MIMIILFKTWFQFSSNQVCPRSLWLVVAIALRVADGVVAVLVEVPGENINLWFTLGYVPHCHADFHKQNKYLVGQSSWRAVHHHSQALPPSQSPSPSQSPLSPSSPSSPPPASPMFTWYSNRGQSSWMRGCRRFSSRPPRRRHSSICHVYTLRPPAMVMTWPFLRPLVHVIVIVTDKPPYRFPLPDLEDPSSSCNGHSTPPFKLAWINHSTNTHSTPPFGKSVKSNPHPIAVQKFHKKIFHDVTMNSMTLAS